MKKARYSWLLIMPMLLLMGGLVYLPIIRTFIYSLHKYKLTRPNHIKYIGLENYYEVLNSDQFYHSLQNSLIILLTVITLTFVCSIFVALLLNKKSKLSSLLIGIAIIPWALPPIVNGIIWQFIFHPSYGLVKKILIATGQINSTVNWLNDRYILLICVSVVIAWRVVPFCSLILLSTLKSIPNDLYEAATIDGANSIQTFFHITFTALIPSFFIILIQATMAGINVFDEVVALVGYRFEGQTLLIYNYLNTFSFLDFGLGSAITYIIMIFSGIIGLMYIRSLRMENAHVKKA